MELDAALAMARGLLDEHGLSGWTVVLDRARTRAGVCRADRREIGLSAPLTALHEEAEVRDTVLHEVAHALVGPGHGHDAVWRATARRIGCSGERTSTAARVPGAWTGTCPAGHVVTRHRRPTRVLCCGRCGRRPDPANVLSWALGGRPVPPEELGPGYRREWEHLRHGGPDPRRRLPVGARVRVGGGGRHAGTTGRVVRVGRSRYLVRTGAGVLTVPFALAEEAPGLSGR